MGTGRRKWTKVQEIPAFIYALVLFHFFGLRNARETTVYGFVYLYDIIIFSECWKQNFCDVQAVLDKLKSAALSVNKMKSKLFKTYLNDGAVFCLQLAVMLILTRLRL